ncbi:MAG: Gfo/Idh/MocA family oxidoreductase [Chloroflexi bacterium]|nr:Gfo/Idh/MocA family oxidoreductase [Chloroflexota bacterium]
MPSILPRLAIIGCGAIFEKWHLRALRKLSWRPEILVDQNEERLERLRQESKARAVATDYRKVIGEADAAIVAVPHGLHAEICIPLIENGLDLLIEKPLALSSADCERISDAARSNNRIVAVGHMRRFLSGHRWLKSLLDNNGLGDIQSADFREGGPFSWPVASPAIWSREHYGGGVLFDTGAHTLDLLLWWLGDVTIQSYRDDNFGGVEADCVGELKLVGGGVAKFELSRTRKLRGTAVIVGSKGQIEIDLVTGSIIANPPELMNHDHVGMSGRNLPTEGFLTMYVNQLANFRDSIIQRDAPLCSALDATGVVSLLERCYDKHEPIDLPWVTASSIRTNDQTKVANES